MATFAATYHPKKALPTKVTALATVSSSAEIPLYKNALIAIVATGNVHVAFGYIGTIPDAAATGWLVPAGATHQFDLGQFTAIKLFNPTGGNIDAYMIELCR